MHESGRSPFHLQPCDGSFTKDPSGQQTVSHFGEGFDSHFALVPFVVTRWDDGMV